ncbi:MAG: PIN domain-containing protein [Thaumarchaeota archaeon]|nr:PIN domain-containing protein [Nitrososphaerota archaeon]
MADTRLLLTLQFPPDAGTKKTVEELTRRELSKRLLAPAMVLTEFVKVAGSRIGGEAARVRLTILKDLGMRTVAFGEEEALAAGDLLLSHREVPIADAMIAAFVKTGAAEYVVTDDAHYRTLGIRTRWY